MIWRIILFWLLGASAAFADLPRHSHVFAYDNGVAAGPGVLTQMGDPNQNCANWNGGVSPFSRVNTETNTSVGYSTYGRINGKSALTVLLDGQPLSVTTNSSFDPSYPFQWRAQMQVTPGAHQLKVMAQHPSGFYTASATNWFTNNMGCETAAIMRDSDGNIEQRTWSDTNGNILHQQLLTFDVKNRLTDITDVDGTHTGIVWHTEYDGLDRRFVTESWVMTNGEAQIYGVTPQTIYQYYDPNVEFLELGVSVNNQTTWKLYGPDLNGKYGGLNGTGGLDGVSPYLNEFNPVISDSRGNILAEVTNGVVVWNPARPTGYGFVPGYQPIALGHGADLAQACAWRGRWMDATGYYQIGLRPYDPVAGNWLSYDSVFDQHNPNGLSAFGGDPINYFDSDGRCIETGLDMLQRTVGGIGQLGATGYDLLAQTAWAADGSGGEYQGVSQLYQNIYNNPGSGPTAGNIVSGTLQTDANIASLGLYGMAQGYYNGITTGDYTQAQNASLNALLLSSSAQAMVNQGINPYSFGYGSSTPPTLVNTAPAATTPTAASATADVTDSGNAVQLEFPFANGASVQTPGVTASGETFVRVGASPQNLKFGSTSLSGVQPGTYAFPQATFDAIGQDPVALQNLGDLPGNAPQYYRILQPPPGTPIQRGIVPGGQFGGAGGAQEVIFPSGF
jgi:RHS repeat-associated protein